MGERTVLFPASRPTLTDRNAREYYGHRTDFQRIVKRIGSPDNRKRLIEKIEAELSSDQKLVLLKRLLFGLQCMLGIMILLAVFKIIALPWMIADLLGFVLLLSQVDGVAKRRQKSHMDKYMDSLQRAEDHDVELINRIEKEWDEYCVNFTDYPPDWRYRKLLVLERDQRICSQCGWPEGVKRMVRELHVHHVKPLSRGGNNELSNLVVLCDICHRQQEGPGHARINPRRRKKKRGVDV